MFLMLRLQRLEFWTSSTLLMWFYSGIYSFPFLGETACTLTLLTYCYSEIIENVQVHICSEELHWFEMVRWRSLFGLHFLIRLQLNTRVSVAGVCKYTLCEGGQFCRLREICFPCDQWKFQNRKFWWELAAKLCKSSFWMFTLCKEMQETKGSK